MNLRSFFDALSAGGKAALASTGLGCTGLLAYSFLVDKKVVYLPFALITIALISVLFGGLRGGMAAGSLGWLHGGLVATVYLFMVVLLKMLIYPVSSFNLANLTFVLGVLLTGCIGGMAGINLKYMWRRRLKRRYQMFFN